MRDRINFKMSCLEFSDKIHHKIYAKDNIINEENILIDELKIKQNVIENSNMHNQTKVKNLQRQKDKAKYI